MSACATCEAENQDELEEAGELAVKGEISWREAARRTGLTHHTGLKAHMTRHWTPPKVPGAAGVEQSLIFSTAAELEAQARLAPPELKPLYLVAIQNLVGLTKTKPSQHNLIIALKAISEITGMKMEQRFMLEFGQAMFAAPLPSPAVAELSPGADGDIVDAELVN